MRKYLLDPTKKFYKGNMHCHSNLSDGHYTPEELKKLYKEQGYSFLAITDHEFVVAHPELNDENFVAITATEYAIKQFPEQSTLKNFNMKVCHLNFYAKEQSNDYCVDYNSVYDHYSGKSGVTGLNKPEGGDVPRVYGAEGINNLIKNAKEHGYFVCYNHPRWSLENYGDYKDYEGLWGVEVYNHSCGVGGLYDYDINVVDDMLRDGKRVFVSCGDDNHNARVDERMLDSFGAFVMVNIDELSYSSIIDGLLSGKFYASMGPVIDELYVEDGKVYIKCSDAKRISYSTRGRRTKAVNAMDGYVNEAVFEIKDTDEYFRIDVMDEQGRRANTQAYYLNEI